MKHLYLMRHAKTEEGSWGMKDFDRQLTHRGLNDAACMAGKLAGQLPRPEIMVSSPAKRTMATAEVLKQHPAFSGVPILPEAVIYQAIVHELPHIIQNLSELYQTAMLIGHNPAFTHLCGWLTPQHLNALPTAGVYLVKLPIDSWQNLSEGCGELIWIDSPKEE